MTPEALAPAPAALGERTVVAAELVAAEGRLTFDVARRRASAEVVVELAVTAPGWPAFDLRQPILSASIDGRPVDPARLAHQDLGGGPGAQMRVLPGPLTPGGTHRLELEYELGIPDVPEPRPIGWGDGAVDFDVWSSDLHPARYLEQWLPVGLCQDAFALTLDVRVTRAAIGHRLIANGTVTELADHSWRVAWPAHHTPLSSLLLVLPAATQRAAAKTSTATGIEVELTAGARLPESVDRLAEQVAGWLEANGARLGPYGHGRRFVAHAWESRRGMEYDGATTGSVQSLEHETFHSWFGRGVKPACANDGWIDEAITTWTTSEVAEAPRLAAVTFPLDEEPVVLCPASPWSRHTPREAYRTGYRLFAQLAHLAGDADRVLEALAGTYRAHAGGHLTTAGLATELSEALSVDVGPWWDRYVYGRG